jgi:hypothetical protein
MLRTRSFGSPAESRPPNIVCAYMQLMHGQDDGPPGTPRWAYATAIVVVVLAVAFVVMHLAGGGFVGH